MAVGALDAPKRGYDDTQRPKALDVVVPLSSPIAFDRIATPELAKFERHTMVVDPNAIAWPTVTHSISGSRPPALLSALPP